MPPPAKRKRPDHRSSDFGSSRPSPHRPGDTAMGQHDRNFRGGRNSRRSDRRDSSQSFNGPHPSNAGPGPISPSTSRPRDPSPSNSISRQNIAPVQPVQFSPAAAPAPAPPSAPIPTTPIASGYDYTIVNDDRVSRWTKGGKQELVDYGSQSFQDEDFTELTAIYQELIHSVVDLRVSGLEAGTIVKEILALDPVEAGQENLTPNSAMLFLDTFQIFMDFEADSYRDEVRSFLMATGISPDLIRLILDVEVLKRLGLVRDGFSKASVRYATNILYRQANYNLLREETEGYSKLLTEMFTTSSTEPPSSETVQATFERTMGLIGAFDLDVGRVLDVLMDIFAAILIKQFKFFVKYLRISSWWPRSQTVRSATSTHFIGGLPLWALPDHSSWLTTEEEEADLQLQRQQRDVVFWSRAREVHLRAYFELGARQPADADVQRVADLAVQNGQAVSIEQQWIATTKTLPPIGNQDAAQILGFKLRFYSSDARDDSEIDVLPANLLYLAALLIKIGFISITDLWPHLWPEDEKFKEDKMKDLEEKERQKRGGTTNALMMAGALPDDTPAPVPRREAVAAAKTEAEKKPTETSESKLRQPKEQKGLLLVCLLTIGAIPEALFIIGRYEWVLEAFADEILPLIHRIINHSIEPLYKRSRPNGASLNESVNLKPMPDIDQSSATKGTVNLSIPPPKRTLKWPYPDKFDSPDGNAYRFYWDEWADNIPICQSVDDLFTLCNTLLNISGVNIGKEPALVARLTSIGTQSMADDPSASNIARWHDLLRRLLVPSLSLGEPNSSNVAAIWNMVRHFSVKDRYTLYADWFEGPISRLPPVRKAFAQTRSEALSIMKRLSRDNLQEMAKKLAKTAFPSPGIVFRVALDQMQAYTNLIQVFVECGKYFTSMGYDVLVWSVLNAMGQNRSRTQADSILHTSQWLQALSKFSGKVFQQYAVMDPAPVIQYVNDQLYKGNATDLVILRELIESMGGVIPDLNFTEAQRRAMTGGELLRRETLISLGDRREKSSQSARHLVKALVDNKLAGQLLVNIAQYRQSAIYNVSNGSAHIKYLSTVLDDTHQTLVQYLELLRSNLDTSKFDSLVPGTVQLIQEYGLDVNLAFMVTRASLRAKNGVEVTTNKDAPAADGDGDMVMGDNLEANEVDSGTTKTTSNRKADAFLDSLQPLVQSFSTSMPETAWANMTPEFYVLFWSLQLNDLIFPQQSYIAENNRLKKLAEEVMRQKSDNVRTAADRQQEQAQKQEQRKEILARLKQLNDEQKHDLEYFGKARFALIRQAGNNAWLVGGVTKCNAIADALLEKCILPRIVLSFLDVEYSFKMIKFLHDCSVSNFKLMAFYDRLFQHNRLRSLIFTCTERESEHLAHFLKCILEELTRWHGDRAAYDKEALGEKEIKATKDTPSKKTRTFVGFAEAYDEEGKPTSFLEHKAFKDALLRWHKNLNTALRSCLGDTEWMHIRNAMTVLKAVLDFFPAIDFMGNKFLEQLKEIAAREAAGKGNRTDLSVTAQTAVAQLQKKKPTWVMIQAFRPGPAGDAKNGSVAPAPTTLRASAPAFKPEKDPRARPGVEVEDGEVRDGKSRQSGDPTNQAAGQSGTAPTKPSTSAREGLREAAIASQREGRSNASTVGTPGNAKATPVTGPAAGARNDSRPSGLPNRPELPRKPNVPLPSNVMVDQYGQIRNHENRRDGMPARDTRDQRDLPRDHREQNSRDMRTEPFSSRDGRDHRMMDGPHPERPRIPNGPDRRAAEPHARDPQRLADRERQSKPDPPRWNDNGPASSDRDMRGPRDRAPGPSREARQVRENRVPTPPPVTSAPDQSHESQASTINPDRARLLAEPDRPEIINPARAALISDSREPARGARDSSRERQAPNNSPRRQDHAGPADAGREERPLRHRHSDYHIQGRDMNNAHGPHVRNDHMTGDRERDGDRDRRDPAAFGGPGGREESSARGSQQDPNYGRLNNPIPSVAGESPSGPPSGPRGRGGRNPNRMNSTNNRQDGRFTGPEPMRPPSPERGPPTGPSASRARRGPYDGGNSSATAPNPPTPPQAPAAGPGVHPDRMRHIGQPAAVHPDRMNHISGPAPYPRSPLSTPDRPSAPARPAPLNVSHSPGNDGPSIHTPTGPSGGGDRRQSGRQLRGLQNHLASADVPRSNRGTPARAPRLSLANSDAQVLTGTPPAAPANERQDAHRSESSRRNMDNDRNAGPMAGEGREGRGGDEFASGFKGDQDRGRRDHPRSDRPNRSSRRNSKERSADRDRGNKEPREHREGEREAGGSRRGHRESSTHHRDHDGSNHRSHRPEGPRAETPAGRHDIPPPPPPPRPDGRESRGEGRGDRAENHGNHREGFHGGRPDDYGNNGRNGPPRGNGGPSRDSRGRPDERGEQRRDDRGRKRRSEADPNADRSDNKRLRG